MTERNSIRHLLKIGLISSLPDPPWTSTTTIPTISRSPSRASRCRKPSSASGAEVAAAYFLDSSALVKRYVQENGTAWVRRLTRRNRSTAHLHRPHHRRRSHLPPSPAAAKAGRSPPPTASSILHRFRQHLAGGIPSSRSRPPCSTTPCGWRIAHALRAYDAVQLAAALEVNQERSGRRFRPR